MLSYKRLLLKNIARLLTLVSYGAETQYLVAKSMVIACTRWDDVPKETLEIFIDQVYKFGKQTGEAVRARDMIVDEFKYLINLRE